MVKQFRRVNYMDDCPFLAILCTSPKTNIMDTQNDDHGLEKNPPLSLRKVTGGQPYQVGAPMVWIFGTSL